MDIGTIDIHFDNWIKSDYYANDIRLKNYFQSNDFHSNYDSLLQSYVATLTFDKTVNISGKNATYYKDHEAVSYSGYRVVLLINGIRPRHNGIIHNFTYLRGSYFASKVVEVPPGTGTPIPPGGLPSYSPPDKLTPENVEDIPFYNDLLENGQIETLDDLSQEEYDYIQEELQKQEVGWFDSIISKTKDLFMSSADNEIYRDMNISYDPNNPEIVSYYGDNGLDTSKNYNFNMDGLRVGFKKDGQILDIKTDSKVNSSGNYTISNDSKNSFLSDGELYIPLSTTNDYSLGGSGVAVNVGTVGLIGLMQSGLIESAAEKTVDLGFQGLTYLSKKAQDLYKGWTSTGDKNIDIMNTDVRSEAYTKGMNTVTKGEGVKVADVKGTLTVDTTKISFDPITVASGTTIPMELATGTTIPMELATGTTVPMELAPGTEIGVNVGTKTLPLDIGTKTIPVNVDGKSIPVTVNDSINLDVVEGTTVKLDTTDSLLSLEGFGDLWTTFLTNFVSQLNHKNSLAANETTELQNKIVAHDIEYGEQGVRTLEKGVATWKNTEYETTVVEGTTEVNKIDRDIKAWQGIHSSNLDTSYTGELDTAGNPINVTKGLIGALTGAGIIEYLREGAMSKSLENVKAQAMADQVERNSDNSEDDENEKEKEDILRGLKKVVYPGVSDYVSQGESFGSDLKDLQVHTSKMEVK